MTRCGSCSLVALAALLLFPIYSIAQVEKPADVTGNWEMTVETPVGNFTSTIKLTRMGDQLTGVSIGQDGKATKLDNLKLDGKTLNFSEEANYGGADYHLVYTGTVAGDAIHGTFETMGQTMDWSAKRAGTLASALSSPAGTWTLSAQTQNGVREGTLALKQDGDQLTGTLTGPTDHPVPLQDVSLKGKELRFTVPWQIDGNSVKLTFVTTVDGDSLTGTVTDGGDKAISLTGKRTPAPAASATAAGTWKLTIKAPDHTYQPTITLTQEAGKWSGQLVTEQGDKAALNDLVVNGKQLEFTADLDAGGNTIHLKFSGAVDGEKLTGTMAANGGDGLPTTGDRVPKA